MVDKNNGHKGKDAGKKIVFPKKTPKITGPGKPAKRNGK